MDRFRANVKKLQVIKTYTARSYFIEHFRAILSHVRHTEKSIYELVPQGGYLGAPRPMHHLMAPTPTEHWSIDYVEYEVDLSREWPFISNKSYKQIIVIEYGQVRRTTDQIGLA